MDKIVSVNIAGWLACALFVAIFAKVMMQIAAGIRGKEAHPPNQVLNAENASLRRQVEEHSAAIEKVWFTMREEDSKTRDTLSKAIQDFERALGQIEGTIGEANKTMRDLFNDRLRREDK